MTRSIWKLSHLSLALVASLFLILASISGLFLAYEPVQKRMETPFSSDWNAVSLASAMDSLKENYFEITSIERDQNGFFIASVFTEEGEQLSIPFDPTTGKKAGEIHKQSPFFEWMTTFHRSLFLDQIGRFFVGIGAVLLFFIAVSGIALVIQRSKSIRSLFDKVEKTLNVQFFHIVFGRLAFVPIAIISLTGAFLFLHRFDVVKKQETPTIQVDFQKSNAKAQTVDFSSLKLGDLTKVDFPLFPDEEEFFVVHTPENVRAIDQFEFKILDEVQIPQTTAWVNFSLDLHTGRTNPYWAVVLGLTCLCILYFIYSGFKMTYLKWKAKTKNAFKLEESTILILFGSEGGNSAQHAKTVFNALIAAGQKVYISALNQYRRATNIEHVLIFTSTYGIGEAPASASKFKTLWTKNPMEHSFSFSIIGFGSLAYPDFCKYAEEVRNLLLQQENAKETVGLAKIHNQSYHSVKTWAHDWKEATSIDFQLPSSVHTKKVNVSQFTVLDKKVVADGVSETFILTLKTHKNDCKSGDLLVFYPEKDPFERMYSIGKIDATTLVVSIKRHAFGIASNVLFNLSVGDVIEAGIKKNASFHYNASKDAVFIGNGTGMGPFLGMLTENQKGKFTALYWGGRTMTSYELYADSIQSYMKNGVLSQSAIAYSREKEIPKTYVGVLLLQDGVQIANMLKTGGIVYICGSLSMQQDVLEILNKISKSHTNKPLSVYQKRQQIKMDCY